MPRRQSAGPGLTGAIEEVLTSAVALVCGIVRVALCLAGFGLALAVAFAFALIAGASHASGAAARPRSGRQAPPSLD